MRYLLIIISVFTSTIIFAQTNVNNDSTNLDTRLSSYNNCIELTVDCIDCCQYLKKGCSQKEIAYRIIYAAKLNLTKEQIQCMDKQIIEVANYLIGNKDLNSKLQLLDIEKLEKGKDSEKTIPFLTTD